MIVMNSINVFLSQITLADLQRTLNQTLVLKAKLLLITQPLPQKALPFDVVEIELVGTMQ